eukprot:10608986-Lingulodinium_polyedra.AAC.1
MFNSVGFRVSARERLRLICFQRRAVAQFLQRGRLECGAEQRDAKQSQAMPRHATRCAASQRRAEVGRPS